MQGVSLVVLSMSWAAGLLRLSAMSFRLLATAREALSISFRRFVPVCWFGTPLTYHRQRESI